MVEYIFSFLILLLAFFKHMTRMVTLLKENAETPIMTFHITITGKYSTFKKDITVRYNPETVIMPVNNVTVNPDGIVF